jgi:hypothetical protein
MDLAIGAGDDWTFFPLFPLVTQGGNANDSKVHEEKPFKKLVEVKS